MADKALYVVGQKRFVATMRKAGADLKQLKEVNRQAAGVALPAVKALAPRGRIVGRQFVNSGVASTEPQWTRLYKQYVDKTLEQIKGA